MSGGRRPLPPGHDVRLSGRGRSVSAARKEIDYEDGLRLVRQLVAAGRFAVAVRWTDHLCRQRPKDPRAHNQAGLVRQRQGEPQEAAPHFRRAALLQPEAGEIWANLGRSLRLSAAIEPAFRCRRRAVLCQPEMPEMRLAYGFDLLTVGEYRAGFAEYEHRPDRNTGLARYEAAGLSAWDGRIRPNGRLIVVTEQGAGDVVQFLRFVEPLAKQGMRVTVACPRPLERVVRSAPGVEATAPLWPSGPLQGYDGVEMLLSLPNRLGIDLASLPAPARYISPPEGGYRVEPDGRLRVGVCWTGSTFTPLNPMRRIPFAELARVLDVPGLSFYGLQVLIGRRETYGEDRLVDLAPHIEDFSDTAAMVDQMDLVITVDTSIAHIAGALGKPVWTLLARVADWRWGRDGETTPWYPSMRLFRQDRQGDWAGVVDRVVSALRQRVEAPVGLAERRPFASPDPTG